MSDNKLVRSRSELERLAFEAYRWHGWPMDPVLFAERVLGLVGLTFEASDDPGGPTDDWLHGHEQTTQ